MRAIGPRRKIPETVTGLGNPVCNPDLSPEEQRFWFAIVDSLPHGLLSRADEQALERASIAWARMWECRRKINERGLTVSGPNGPTRNPLIIIEKDAREELHRAGEILGLSPVARARITAPDGAGDEDPTELLMAGVEFGRVVLDLGHAVVLGRAVPPAQARAQAQGPARGRLVHRFLASALVVLSNRLATSPKCAAARSRSP